MSRPHIFKLPCELQLKTLDQLSHDLESLAALESTCRFYRGLFHEHKAKFLHAAVVKRKLIPKRLLTEAILVQKVPRNTPEDVVAAGEGVAMVELLHRYQALGAVDAEIKLTDLSMREALSMAKFHQVIVESLAAYHVEYCRKQMKTRRWYWDRPTSPREALRIRKALYRFELYLRALGDSGHHRALRSYFVKHLDPDTRPHEVDQLIDIQSFLQQIIQEAFNSTTRGTRLGAHRPLLRSDFTLMLGLRWSFSFVIVGLCNWPKDLVRQQRHDILAVAQTQRSRSKFRFTIHNNSTFGRGFVSKTGTPSMVSFKGDGDGSAYAWSEALGSHSSTWTAIPVQRLHSWGCVFWNGDDVREELRSQSLRSWGWPRREVPVSNALLAHRARFLESISPELLVQGDWD